MKLNLSLFKWVRTALLIAGMALAWLPIGAQAFPVPQWMQGGHSASISGLAGSPDGTMIASSSADGTLKLWSTNGTLLRTLTMQSCPLTALAWSPDGTKLAAGTYYGGYYNGAPGMGLTWLWQASGGWTAASVSLVRVTTNLFGKVTALAFSADNLRLVSGSEAGSNYVTAVADGSFVATRPAFNTTVEPSAVTSVAFSAKGLMASGCEDGTICVYDAAWNLLWTSLYSASAQGSNVTAVAFSPDGSVLASTSLDQTIKLWSTTTWASVQTLSGHTNGVTSVAFSPDGQKLVSGSVDGTVKLWSRASGACLLTIPPQPLPVTAALFSMDNAHLISGCDDGAIRLFSATNGSALGTLGGQNSFIGAAIISPDGTLCASAGGAGTIQVRQTSDGSLVRSLVANSNYVSGLAFSPDGARLASGGGPLDPTVKIWQLTNGALLNTIPATTNGVMALAWSPDGSTLAVGGDSVEQNITFWSTNGTLLGLLPGATSWYTNGVTALAFSPQGNLLLSGGRRPGNMLRVWTNSTGGIWTTGVVVRTYLSTATNNNIESATFSPDGSLVGYGRTAVNVLKIGLPNGTDLTLGSGTNPVLSVAFSPDGTTYAATGQNSVDIWTNNGSSTWALCETITNEVVRPACLAFSPNGNLLLCGREDGTVTLSPNPHGALGQPRLKFTSLKVDPYGTAKITAFVQPWTHYQLLSSADLKNWTFLASVMTNASTLSIAGSPATNAPATFYRATTPP